MEKNLPPRPKEDTIITNFCESYNPQDLGTCNENNITCIDGVRKETCPTNLDKSINCFVSWRCDNHNSAAVAKGCFIDTVPCNERPSPCIRHNNLLFCCCEGDMCNQNATFPGWDTATCKKIETTQGAPAPYFRLGYEYIKEVNGWFKIHRVPAKWNEAHSRCIREGAQLASPINGKFLKIMKDSMEANNIPCGLFTGIHDKLSPGSFSSIEGIPVELLTVPWKKSSVCPEKFGDWIVLRADGTLDSVGTNEEYPFLCYKNNKNGRGLRPLGYVKDDRTGGSYKFHRHAKIWSEAKTVCEQEDAHLVIINSHTEDLVVQELFNEHPDDVIHGSDYPYLAFVGFSKWEEPNEWLTIYGQTLDEAGFSTWGANRPNGTQPEPYCGSIIRNGLLDDNLCRLKLPFICERNLLESDDVDSAENLIDQRSQ